MISPKFDRVFIIISFASKYTIAAVILQKNDQGYEQPIAFFSKALRDAPLKYNIMEKQAFALVKSIKDFRVYILYSHIISYVPNVIFKDILTREGPDGKIGKWIITILEYDLNSSLSIFVTNLQVEIAHACSCHRLLPVILNRPSASQHGPSGGSTGGGISSTSILRPGQIFASTANSPHRFEVCEKA